MMKRFLLCALSALLAQLAVFAVVLTLLLVTGLAQAQTGYSDKYSAKEFHATPAAVVPQVKQANIAIQYPANRTLYFWIVSVNQSGLKSLPSGPFPTNSAPSAISTQLPIEISWQTLGAGYTYDLLMTTTSVPPSGTGSVAVATGVTSSRYVVTGETLSSYTVTNFTNDFVVTNEVYDSTRSTYRIKWNGNTLFDFLSDGTIPFLPVNVLSFGADKTGVRDSLAAFQAAHDLGKGCVYVPAGTYKLSGPVRWSFGACFIGDNGSEYTPAAVINVAANSVAFAPANPLTTYVNVTFKNLKIVGGKNGIDLGQSVETRLEGLSFWDQSGWAITHVLGERHIWRNILCEHQSVTAQGCISLTDPNQTIDAATYLANGWTGANAAGWFDRGQIDRLKDFGWNYLANGGAQDSYVIKATTSSCLGCGQISNTTISNMTTMWSGNQGLIKIDGNVRWVSLSDFVLDSIGSSTVKPDLIYIGANAGAGIIDGVTIRNFSPANGASVFYTNAINVRADMNYSTIVDSEFGGNGTTQYGLRLGAGNPQHPVTLQNCQGYVYVETSSAKFSYNAFNVLGGAIVTNKNLSLQVANFTNADLPIVATGPDGSLTTSYTGNLGFQRFNITAQNMVWDLKLSDTSATFRNGILFNSDNTSDIGANAANRPRTLYVGTSIKYPDGTTQTSAGALSLQKARTTTGCTITSGGSAWLTCTMSVTWPQAFADTTYTVHCTGDGGSGGDFPSKALAPVITTKSTTGVTATFSDAGNGGITYTGMGCQAY